MVKGFSMKHKTKAVISKFLAAALLVTGLPLSVQTVAAESGTQIYVSVAGDDNASGTIDSPLASLEGARDKIRAMKKSGEISGGGGICKCKRWSISLFGGFIQP